MLNSLEHAKQSLRFSILHYMVLSIKEQKMVIEIALSYVRFSIFIKLIPEKNVRIYFPKL